MSAPLDLDILSALEGTSPRRKARICKIQRWLDSIPADQPGRDALAATLITTDPRSDDYRTLDELDAVTAALGLETSIKTIGDHRSRRCRCFR